MRGRRLRVPPETRPTTDRVRAAIFDALQAPPPDRVLDCFAGSGGLGLEALSRGAGYARFVEIKPRAARVITANLRELGIEDRADVVTADALATDLGTAGPYELVLADPPYALDVWQVFFASLDRPGVLARDARVVVEHSSRRPPPDPLRRWSLWKTRTHGDAAFTIYRAP